MKRKATMASTIPASDAFNTSQAPTSLKDLTISKRSGFLEGGHQLEKLEFALALAEAQGDLTRCSTLRDLIADLGGNAEEPGT